jgi:phospholipid transport system substrate-binding protein
MRRRSDCRWAAAAIVAWVAAAAAQSPPQVRTDAPRATIESLHRGLIELSQAPAGDAASRYERLAPLVRATHDLPYIAQFALGRRGDALSPDEQRRFVELFERLSIMSYAARFARLEEGMLRIVGESDAGGGRFEVAAAIGRPDQPDVPLEYVLHENAGTWRIINIVADGVSDLALKRAEYQRVLAGGGADDLLRHLEEQIEALEASAAQPTNR